MPFVKRKKNTDPFVIKEHSAKYGQLKSGYRLNWAEEVFSKTGSKQETLGTSFNFKRVPMISLIFAFFLLVIFTRVAWLQVVKGEYYYELAEDNRIRIERIEAKRGVIYDRNHQPLVRNAANFLLYFVPADLPKNELEKDKIIDRVGEILSDNITSDEIKEKLAKVNEYSKKSRQPLILYQPLFIIDNIDYDKAMLLHLESDQMQGVVLSNRTRREYNLRRDVQCVSTLSHILGYTGKINEQELADYGSEYSPIDYIGKMGVEYFWENELKGVSGKKQIEVDALGKEKKIINQESAEDGHNLVLSLDIPLQEKLEEITTKIEFIIAPQSINTLIIKNA